MTIHSYSMPEEVEKIILSQEQDIDFSVYLTLPQLSEDLPLDSIPLALLSHGWGYPVYENIQIGFLIFLPKVWLLLLSNTPHTSIRQYLKD